MSRRALALLALVAGARLLAGEPLTLPEALRQTAGHSLQADTAHFSVAASQEESAQIKSLYYPEVKLEGGHLNLGHTPTLLSSPMSIGPIALGNLTIGPLTVPSQGTALADQASWRYKLSAQYLVYDWGRRDKALAASRAKDEAVALGGNAAVRRAQAETAARYVALLNVKARKQVVAQRRQTLEDHLRTVKELFEHGVVARNDLLRTEVALRAVNDADLALDRAYASALEALNVSMGLSPIAAQSLPDTLPPPPALPWDEAACRAKAVQSNDSVKALRARLKATEEQLSFRRRDYGPNFVAEAAHTYEQNSHMLNANDNTLYLGLSWKIFDGGARASRIRQAQSEANQVRREAQDAERQAENVAAAALRDVKQALQEEATAQTNVAAALENLRIVEDQYKEGLVKTTDTLDAESVLAESRFGAVDKRCRAYAQQAVLLTALGEDLPAFFETAPTHSTEK